MHTIAIALIGISWWMIRQAGRPEFALPSKIEFAYTNISCGRMRDIPMLRGTKSAASFNAGIAPGEW